MPQLNKWQIQPSGLTSVGNISASEEATVYKQSGMQSHISDKQEIANAIALKHK